MTTEQISSYAYREEMDDLAAYMSKDRSVHPVMGTKHFCPTGEPYIVLMLGGLKREGEGLKVWATDMDAAIRLFKNEFDKYAAEKTGVLYWRRRPEVSVNSYLNHFTGSTETYMAITARIVISDLPVLATETKEEAK